MLLMASWGIVSAIIQKRAKAKKASEQAALGVKTMQRSRGAAAAGTGHAGRKIPAGTRAKVGPGQSAAPGRSGIQQVDILAGTDVRTRSTSTAAQQARATQAEERLAALRKRSMRQRGGQPAQQPAAAAPAPLPGQARARSRAKSQDLGANLIPGVDAKVSHVPEMAPMAIGETIAPMRRTASRKRSSTNIAALLHDRASLRDAIILREILDRPVSERPQATLAG